MVNLISAENISRSYGLKALLDGVSLGVQSGQRIGVVGLNGGGKTTLLEVLSGIEEPDSGRVARNSELRMAVVTQRLTLDPTQTIGDVVLAPLGVAEYEWAANSKVRDVLRGLGLARLGLDTLVGELSGGERRRVSLAAALVQDVDLVVLDEPTNHLDVEGVQWLAEHLLARRIAVIVVTHDRWFLDTVAQTTWEVHDGTVDVYEGGYNDWIFARAERARQADAAEQRRRNLARKELAWLRRGAPARTSKPRYRIEAAEALIADVPAPRDSVELLSFSRARQGRVVVELEDACVATPGGRNLVDHLTWRLAPGERIGLVGVNGSGKTTLLRALAGEGELATGRRIEGKTVRLGWLRQELDDLPAEMTLIESVEAIASRVQVGKKELSAGQLAERLGFSPKRQRTRIGDLSGGERRRLQFTRVLMGEPNLLLLDEPTNDLDIDTLQELEDLLDSWPGTLVVVSHDRYLVERIADSTWALFGDGRLTHLPGGIDQYLERRARQRAANDAAAEKKQPTRGDGGVREATEPVPARSAPARSTKEAHALQKTLRGLEQRIARAEQRLGGMEEEMAAAVQCGETDRLMELDIQARELREAKEDLEAEWFVTAEQLEGEA